MELETTQAFVKVVQLGSFTRAASVLRLPKSSISRMVSRLEEETGTKLLIRTTRTLKLTASGRAFYETCLGPLQQLEDAKKSLQGQDSIVAGVVRITAPEDLGTFYLSPAIGRLALEHPGLQFEFNYTDETVDLVQEGFDLAVRIGRLNPSRFHAKKLGEIVMGLVASRDHGIREPRDLTRHPSIAYLPRIAQPKWILKSGKKTESLSVHPQIVGNQMTSLVRLAAEGAGIAMVPLYLCREHFSTGKLIRVLPEWTGPSFLVSLVSPRSSGSSARLKLVGDTLTAAVQSALQKA